MAPELKRVTKYVVEFVKRALIDNKEFTARDLRLYVSLKLGGELASAPASADRIMRDQRKKGNINYELVSRAKSLYRALPIVEDTDAAKRKADETAAIERKLNVTVPPVQDLTGKVTNSVSSKVEYVTYYGYDNPTTIRFPCGGYKF